MDKKQVARELVGLAKEISAREQHKLTERQQEKIRYALFVVGRNVEDFKEQIEYVVDETMKELEKLKTPKDMARQELVAAVNEQLAKAGFKSWIK